jgi:hypothetical protein
LAASENLAGEISLGSGGRVQNQMLKAQEQSKKAKLQS